MSTGFVASDVARVELDRWYDKFLSQVESRYPTSAQVIETRLGPTQVRSAGPKNAPPIVLLHGAMATSAHVLVEAAPLLRKYRVHAVDVVGQSWKSVERRPSHKDNSYSDWVADVFAGLGLESAILYGVSHGGFVALKGLVAHPRLAKKLVLVVPAGFVNGSAWEGFTQVGWPMMMYKLAPNEARLRKFFLAIFSTWDEDWGHYFADAMKYMKLDLRVPPLFTVEQTAQLTQPTLVIAAEKDLSFPGAKLLERARELFPHAKTDMLLGVRHCPPSTEEAREDLARRVAQFLES